MILIRNVSKHYGNKNNITKAVDEITLSVHEGETVVLLGTSGCGKTTTLRMVNRLIEPSGGEIVINGQNINSQSPDILRRNIGYVLQHHGLFPHYTVAENIAIVPRLLKWESGKINKRIAELLDKLQLSLKISGMYPGQLSGGQQQRVGLARALASDPPLLLMDEPLGALDAVTRAGIRKEFNSLDELKRKTILMVTHDVQEAFELGDRICLMNEGKIRQIGKAVDLLFNPADEFVSDFLKEQRFILELKSITIRDIWSLLPKAISGTEETLITPENNLWEIIEQLSIAEKSDSFRFASVLNNEKKQIDTASVIASFTQYKNLRLYE